MAALAAQAIVQSGLEPVYVAAAGGGDTAPCGDHTFLHVKNGGVGDITVTLDDPRSPQPVGATAWNPDAAIVVTAGEDRMIGPLTASRFANATTGLCGISYSGVTSVTVAVIQA